MSATLAVCCVLDAAALAAGCVLLSRSPFRGRAHELVLLGVVVGLAVLGIAFAAAVPGGGFGALRGACHGLFCVGLPLLALRALVVRSRAPVFALVLLAAFVLGEGVYVFAREVEPFRLEVTTARIRSPRLEGLAEPLRVAVVADLQTDHVGAFEVAVFDRIVAAQPDLVLFLGDYLQLAGDEFFAELPALRAQIERLTPRLGAFAVDGDVDFAGAAGVFRGTKVQVLMDTHVELPGLPIDVVGLSRMRSRAPFLDKGVVQRVTGERFPIVIGHAPDYMLSVLRGGLRCDGLMLAGHTHGGQVQIPGFGPLITLSAVPRWLAGGGVFRHGDTWLCTSRGIGMERAAAPRIRLFCRPQLVLLELGGH